MEYNTISKQVSEDLKFKLKQPWNC